MDDETPKKPLTDDLGQTDSDEVAEAETEIDETKLTQAQPVAKPEGSTSQPTIIKEVEKQTVVKQVAPKSSKEKIPKPVEKVVERVVVQQQPMALPRQKSSKAPWVIVVLLLVIIIVGAGLAWWYLVRKPATEQMQDTSAPSQTQSNGASSSAQGLQLDPDKNYGNKYADGILPVGDGKYVTSGAKKGYVYACSQYAQNLANDPGGADVRGPWFTSNNTEYDISKKVHVAGEVDWMGAFSNTVSGNTRTIVSNDLPLDHPTGTFPIAASDPAYSYDRNPNNISAQSLTYALRAKPSYGNPNCAGGQVGVMLTGVALFSAFDAGGRDAGAWEVQDDCGGHPQSSGEYHYHTLSSCIEDTSVHDVIGFALDGFPITGPKVGTGNILTTDDLDECHGITSQITLDGKDVTMYHYVMTQDFPYSISCYRATAIAPPGQQQQAPPRR